MIQEQKITKDYAIYLGDCMELLPTIPTNSIHLSVYSPPFTGLYTYSSSERDLSNCDSYDQFFKHYEYVVKEIARITLPGRMTAVHCMDTPTGNTGCDAFTDFPGDIIRLHQRLGFDLACRHFIWKEPLAVRNRTMQKNLMHKVMCEDSMNCGVAVADQLLMLRKKGTNTIPVTHEHGMMGYAGEREIPEDVKHYRGWKGSQLANRYSHWIWRQYASCFWDDIRMGHVLPFKEARDEEDEKHVHALQLDVIERCITLRSNPGETVLTPFMGVGSEVFEAVRLGRLGIGIELKPSYYRQSVRNMASIGELQVMQPTLYDGINMNDSMDSEIEGEPELPC